MIANDMDVRARECLHCRFEFDPIMSRGSDFWSTILIVCPKPRNGLFGNRPSCGNYAYMDMWRDSLRRIPPIEYFPVEI